MNFQSFAVPADYAKGMLSAGVLRLLAPFLSALLVSAGAAAGPNVLLIWDDDNDSVSMRPPAPSELSEGTQALIEALEAAGIRVSLTEETQSEYRARNPEPDPFDVVIHLNGNRTSTLDVMATSGVVRLINYVEEGGGIITSENTDVQMNIPLVGLTTQMESLMVLDRSGNGPFGNISLTPVSGQAGHPLLNGLSTPIAFEAARMEGAVREYDTAPATAILRDELGSDAAAVRELGEGRIVSFHHAGNFRNLNQASETLLDPEVQQLYVNAVLWADQTPPQVTTFTPQDNGASAGGDVAYRLTFSEGVEGVGPADLQVTTTGTVTVGTPLSIARIDDRTFDVVVPDAAGLGEVRLDVIDDDSIVDESFSAHPLGGVGEGTGAFQGGAVVIDAAPPELVSLTVTPEPVPLGETGILTLTFGEAMDTGVFPNIELQTEPGGQILASPAGDDGGLGAGDRVDAGLLALYTFLEGSGAVVGDVSGVDPPLDLEIGTDAAVTWLADQGALRLDFPTLVASNGPAAKINDAVASSSAITMEAWVRPADTGQTGPARIVTISESTSARNLTFGQDATAYDVRLRTTATDLNGIPSTATPVGVLQPALQHVVYTRAANGAVRIFIDGAEAASANIGGQMSNWGSDQGLALGNEFTQTRPWLGELHLVAFYDRPLDADEVTQNFMAGPVRPAPGDGMWVNDRTYEASLDRPVEEGDRGEAVVIVEDARDLAGNEMASNSGNTVNLAVTLLEFIREPIPFGFVPAGDTLRLEVEVTGVTGTADFTWFRETRTKQFLPVGPNAPALTIPDATENDSGRYFCVVSDDRDVIQSRAALIIVSNRLPVAGPAALAIAACALGLIGARYRHRF